jgi:Uma2 family endonuclease
MTAIPFLNLYTAIRQADFEKLLKGKSFVMLQGQIIFEKDGEVFITTIDETLDDFTVEDYMALPEGAPFELINGKLVYMPSPNNAHQNSSNNLATHLTFHVKRHKLGFVRTAPLDVHLGKNNVFQPDLMFISNERKDILKDWVYGAPDFIVEILSPGTHQKDRGEKMETYARHGVKEYWLIEPYEQFLEVYINKDGMMHLQQQFKKTGTVRSAFVPGFSIALPDIFED